MAKGATARSACRPSAVWECWKWECWKWECWMGRAIRSVEMTIRPRIDAFPRTLSSLIRMVATAVGPWGIAAPARTRYGFHGRSVLSRRCERSERISQPTHQQPATSNQQPATSNQRTRTRGSTYTFRMSSRLARRRSNSATASSFFCRSRSTTSSGAFVTNCRLLSFFSTLCRKPSFCSISF